MKTRFVAARDDRRALEALKILEYGQFPTRVIDPTSERVEQDEVVLLTSPHPLDVGGRHLCAASHKATDILYRNGGIPDWAASSPFLALLRERSDPRTEAGFPEAVFNLARDYAAWNGEGPPWGTNIPTGENFERYSQWRQQIADALVPDSFVETVMRELNPQGNVAPPVNPIEMVTVLCPHYVGHGLLGDTAGLNRSKLRRLARKLSRVAEAAPRRLVLRAFIPGVEMSEDSWQRVLTPKLWDHPDLSMMLAKAHAALSEALACIEDESGVEIKRTTYLEIGTNELEHGREIVEREGRAVDRLVETLSQGGRDYTQYPAYVLREHALWSAALYRILPKHFSPNTLFLGMEAGREGWNAVWPDVRRQHPHFNVWWFPRGVRQRWG